MPPQMPQGRPEPRNSWEQAERILEMLARNPIAPPPAQPYPPSPYPPAYGLEPEDRIWQNENGPWRVPDALSPGYDGLTAPGGLPPAPNWHPAETGPWPLPSGIPDPQPWNTMEFDPARAAAEGFNPYAEPNAEDDGATNQGGQTQIAQVLRPWSPYGDGPAQPEAGDGIWPAGWKDGKPPRQPKYPDTDGVEGVIPPRGSGKGGQGTTDQPKLPASEARPNPGEIPSAKPEKHHVYPRQFRHEFERRGHRYRRSETYPRDTARSASRQRYRNTLEEIQSSVGRIPGRKPHLWSQRYS